MYFLNNCRHLAKRNALVHCQKVLSKLYCSPACQASCSPQEVTDPCTKISLLPNGVRVATEFQDSPIACITLCVEAGSRFETAHNNGMCHFIEHLAYKGIKGNTNIEETMQLMGARLTVNTTREMQTFSAKCFPENAADIVGLLCGIITGLTVDSSILEIAKYNISTEMIDFDNNPRALCFDYLNQTAFQGTPLANPVIGKTNTIQNMDSNLVITFLKEFYQPYKLVLASSGRLDHQAMMKYADENLGHMVGDAAFQSLGGTTRYTGSSIYYRDDSLPYAHVAVAFETPGYMEDEYLVLYLASFFTGDYHRSSCHRAGHGAQFARAGAHDLAECGESFYIAYRDVGLWGCYVISENMSVEHMIDNMQNQWMRNCYMMTFHELERAKQYCKMQLFRNVEGVVRSAHDLGFQTMYTCTRKSAEELVHMIMSYKVENILKVCEKYLYDRCPVVAAVGPTEATPDYVKIRAGQYWLRL